MSNVPKNTIGRVRIGRRLVQTGFLLLFLFPWLPVLLHRLYGKETQPMTSWLLPFDVLLNGSKALHGDFAWIVAGAALFVAAGSWVLGRSFCGWICPIGTILDWIRPLFFWQRKKTVRPSAKNSRLRFRILVFVLVASFLSLQFTGWLDPLVIFNRTASAIITNLAIFDLSNLRILPFTGFLLFAVIVILEFLQPRFWCRNVCPFGALISLPAHFSLMNRRVTNDCTYCGECRNICPMRAIGPEPHETRYADCTFCLDCEAACPNQGISFGFGKLASSRWKKIPPTDGMKDQPITGSYEETGSMVPGTISRRRVLELVAAGGVGLAAAPALNLLRPQTGLVRPPGALPEAQFTQTCISCQECIRICPSQALRPALFEGGLTSIGTPYLSPRQGACSFNPSCPQLCAQVCPVGAIRSIPVHKMKTGIARVNHNTCLAWDQGVKCLVCVEACLSDAAKSENGRVIVNAEKCTGCGRCESGCPVPGSAIKVYPL